MKKYYIILLSLLSLLGASSSCVKDTPQEDVTKAKTYNYFAVSSVSPAPGAESVIPVPVGGGVVTLEIESNVDWKVSGEDGLALDRKEGDGNGTVSVEVPANLSFDAKTYSIVASTERELDADDPAQPSYFGKKISYTISQPGLKKVFSVDKSLFEVDCATTQVQFTLTENVGYSISCSKGLSFEESKIEEGLHLISLNFSQNDDTAEKQYVATLTPALSGVSPIEVKVTQGKFEPVFYVDNTDIKIGSIESSFSFLLSENVGYDVSCGAGVTLDKTEEEAGSHRIFCSVPVNTQAVKKQYSVTVKSHRSGLADIVVSVTQGAYKTIIIDVSNSADLRYDVNGVSTVLPTRSGTTKFVECEFYHVDYPQYLFQGKVDRWGATLNIFDKTCVRVPRIADYKLTKVEITGAYAYTGNRDYKISSTSGPFTSVDCVLGTSVLSFTGKADSGDTSFPKFWNLADSYDPQRDYYFSSSKEGAFSFILTYVYYGVE